MGLYDRDYLRDDRPRTTWTDLSITTRLVIINFALFLLDYVLGESVRGKRLFDWTGLWSSLPRQPWYAWQLLTYGFSHASADLRHVGFNMLGLWFFGREIEEIYGRRVYLQAYLSFIVLSGLAWVAAENLAGGVDSPLVGASGGVMAIIILFVLHFPRRLIYVWGVLPVPAWLLGGLYVLGDVSGVMQEPRPSEGPLVAHTAHLAGAAFGFLFFRTGWHLGKLLPGRWPVRRPKLRVRDAQQEDEPVDLNREVDRILAKISASGEASLTAKERRTLEEASRRYQRRRR